MIRPATAADADGLRACARSAYAPYVTRIGREPAPMGADYRALVAAGQVWVESDEHGHMLGFIVFRPEGDAMLLENVAVRPEAAGQGIGRALIAFCEETARARGCRAVTLYTNEAMTGNLTLYPRLGYRETGRRIEDGFRRVYFEKPLTD